MVNSIRSSWISWRAGLPFPRLNASPRFEIPDVKSWAFFRVCFVILQRFGHRMPWDWLARSTGLALSSA